jgi:hypothetical protein
LPEKSGNEQWATRSSCGREEEPGAFHWALQRIDDETARIRLWWLVSPQRKTKRLDATCHFRTLVRAVVDGVEAMLADVGGAERYAEKWGMLAYTTRPGVAPEGDFPSKAYEVARTFAHAG